MAKVTGPLMSMDARGKIGDALVFIGWKGVKDVRMWLKPANPKLPDQGDIRLVLGGLGRACGKVKKEKAYAVKLVDGGTIPSSQSKQSYLVKYLKDAYMAGKGATMTGNYASILAELTGHTAYTTWIAKADAAGFIDFDMVYATIDPFEKALGLYLLAKAAIALNFTGSPYTKALTSWTATQIDKLVAHLS